MIDTPAPGWVNRAPFATAPVVRISGGNHPFILRGDDVWLIESGQVDVFAVRVEGAVQRGVRSHLMRLGTGQALLGLGDACMLVEFALLAVAAGPIVLRQVSRSDFLSPTDAASRADVEHMIESWIRALAGAFVNPMPPQRCIEWDSAPRMDLAAAGTARPSHRVLWATVHVGSVAQFGMESLLLSALAPTPLAPSTWVQAVEPATLELQTTQQVCASGTVWLGIDRLHAAVVVAARAASSARGDAERTRTTRRTEARQTVMRAACLNLASVLQTESVRAEAERSSAPPSAAMGYLGRLLHAAQLIGKVQGITVTAPAAGGGGPRSRDPLSAIARASRFRTRRVALRDEWFRQNNGPLLAYRAKEHEPVALLGLDGSDGVYQLFDREFPHGIVVTQAIADQLEPMADSFYRPFPSRALGLKDVVRFGIVGCARELKTVGWMSLFAALLGLLPSVVVGMVFNDVIPAAQRSQLAQLTVMLIAIAISTALFNVTRSIALLRLEAKMGNAVQSAVWDRLLSLPTSFFRPYTAGELASSAMGIDAIRQVISGTTVTALVAGVFSLAHFGLLFYYSKSLALWASLLILLALTVSMIGSWLQIATQRTVFAIDAKASGTVLQLLSNVGKLRVANAESHAFARWAHGFATKRRLLYKTRTISNLVAAFNAAFPLLANAIIYWIAFGLLTSGVGLKTGDFLAFLSSFVTCLTNVIVASTAMLTALNVIPLFEQARPILEALPEVTDAKTEPGPLTGAVDIQHAVFRYEQDGKDILKDVSMTIQPGQFVAFVGPSGSGKSTLLRILLGFEQLQSGAVYFDGQDLTGLDVQAVRRQIGVVLQNGRLMSGDIFTNIVGSSLATVDDAWEAARMAGFDGDVKLMPMGMHTVINEGGGTLSGGQRQRLLIARAIVHRPRLLLFDEATSALDNRTQAIVSESLEHLQATRIVVAHRMSTIMKADQIHVMQAGCIVESGTYGELFARGGLFTELARRQMA